MPPKEQQPTTEQPARDDATVAIGYVGNIVRSIYIVGKGYTVAGTITADDADAYAAAVGRLHKLSKTTRMP